MSLQAYKKVATRGENPREMEYRLFGEITRALMEADRADPADLQVRIKALDMNRRLWSALATDCSSPDNGLPAPLRASIVSLSLWVSRHTSAVMRRDEPIEDLVEINKIIMQGLAPQAPAASAA